MMAIFSFLANMFRKSTHEAVNEDFLVSNECADKTIFLGGKDGLTVTLAGDIKAGFRCSFIATVQPIGNPYFITTEGLAKIFNGVSSSADCAASDSASDFNMIILDVKRTAIGDRVDIVSDGKSLFVYGNVRDADGLTFDTIE